MTPLKYSFEAWKLVPGPFYDFKKMLILWGLTQKNEKFKTHYNRLLSNCNWLETEKGPELGSSLQNQTKTEF